ncbi:helix-turn-helix transcriptional regulator [Salinigranum marinum]|uniref:helix-turn-helix transcriptional regulator n=1 Tax=Salinigranum marinum TaxID=1515595 RepID=UPI002989FCAE|nr:helix-turn-helix domain-containing protein [Salinigranum marinum]
MTPEDDAAAELRRLADQRTNMLAMLVEGGSDKSGLTAELGVSRSTVDRAVRRLEGAGLVRRDRGGVTATRAGRLAHESYRRYCERTADVARFGDLLRELPATADVGPELLDGATAHRSEPPAMGRPANEVIERFERATKMWICASAINDAEASARLHEMVTERGGYADVVYTSNLASHLREWYLDKRHEMAVTGRYRAYEIDDLSYDLFVIESLDGTGVAVVVYGDGGRLDGVIVNDTDAAVAWGKEAFERRRSAATEFTDDFLAGGSDAGADGDRGG